MQAETPSTVLGRVGIGTYGEDLGMTAFGSYAPKQASQSTPVFTSDAPSSTVTGSGAGATSTNNMLLIGGVAVVVVLGVGAAVMMSGKKKR